MTSTIEQLGPAADLNATDFAVLGSIIRDNSGTAALPTSTPKIARLVAVGALDDQGRVTAHGKELAAGHLYSGLRGDAIRSAINDYTPPGPAAPTAAQRNLILQCARHPKARIVRVATTDRQVCLNAGWIQQGKGWYATTEAGSAAAGIEHDAAEYAARMGLPAPAPLAAQQPTRTARPRRTGPAAVDTPAVIARPGEIVDICAGPGGWDVGAQIIGLPAMVGLDVNADACATAEAAGFRRVRGDMRKVAPKRHRGLAGCVISPPCPSWSPAGKRAGRRDIQQVLDAFTCLGIDCGCDWPKLIHEVEDPRAALALEVARWGLLTPDLPWLVAELTEGAELLWDSMVAELYSAGWQFADVFELDAADYGLPSTRPRIFLIARQYLPQTVEITPAEPLPRVTAAAALGWQPGVKVITRGNRRPTGGNAFSADKASWCITGKTRSWEIGHVGGAKFTEAEAGHLVGFRRDYPWTGSSRTSRFQRIGDVVSPVIAAVVLGVATGTAWEAPVRAYLDELYGHAERTIPVPPPPQPMQMQLF